MGFSRQEYWSGSPFPSPGDLPDRGINPRFPALQADSLPTELGGKPPNCLDKDYHRPKLQITEASCTSVHSFMSTAGVPSGMWLGSCPRDSHSVWSLCAAGCARESESFFHHDWSCPFSGGHVNSCISTWLWCVITAMWLWWCGHGPQWLWLCVCFLCGCGPVAVSCVAVHVSRAPMLCCSP